MKTFLEPSTAAYASYCAGFCLRYFAVFGSVYCLLHVIGKDRWFSYRVQTTFTSRQEVRHEIRWSMINMLGTGLSTMLFYKLVRDGDTRMYFAIADYGWLYLGASIIVAIVGYETWNYWQHRLLHTSWLFRYVHLAHHRVTNPSAFSSFARHPVEAFMEYAFFILFVVLVPVHPIALGAIVLFFFSFGIVGHLGYEFFPAGFTRHPLSQWVNTATHHNMHHSLSGCNYSNWFNFWDRVMGTNHRDYHSTFDAVTARRGRAIESGPTPREVILRGGPVPRRAA